MGRKRMRMVATWARVAKPWGARVLLPMPAMMPDSMAQAMASAAQSDTSSESVKAEVSPVTAGWPA